MKKLIDHPILMPTTFSLLFCYESDIMCQQQPEAEGEKNNGSGQMGSKFGRRFFSPRPNKGRLECSRVGKRNGGSREAFEKALHTTIFVELRWSNKIHLDANFLDRWSIFSSFLNGFLNE
jgi:hypothetical protein